MTPERTEKFKRVAYNRQFNLTVVLENVHDSHNIGAVLRSCDSVGVREIYVLNTEARLQKENLTLGKRTSAGTRKWVDVHYFTDAIACFIEIRKKYERILCSQIDPPASDLYTLDMTSSIALVFGNEHDGVSQEVSNLCDGNFFIPQKGMVESLNISVACAVSLYEAFRQRTLKGMYSNNQTASESDKESLFETYVNRHEERYIQKHVLKKGKK